MRMLPIALAAGLMAPAAAAQSPALPPTLHHAVERAIAETGARGIAVATIEHGQVAGMEAFGARNAAGDPLRTDTVMYGASLTKAVVGYLTLMLAAEGKLDLDAPIATLLPRPLPEYGNLDTYGNWGDLSDDDRWRRITPRMVLNHSTGFANFAYLEPDERLRIHFDPGTHYG
jgi:CubicO group peptidase (beta-lactamase class C family)